ncbi:hypothetical protein [Ignatzschineria sp. LJL83]
MNAMFEIITSYDHLLISEFMITLGMLLAPTFVSIIAGFLMALVLHTVKSLNGFLNFVTLPIRMMMFVVAGSPAIVLAVLLMPFVMSEFATKVDDEVAKPILMIWGTCYFASLLFRSFSEDGNQDGLAFKIVRNLRTLMIGMISVSAVLGMLGMGGLGFIILKFGFFEGNYAFALVVALMYALMILAVEFVTSSILKILADKQKIEIEHTVTKYQQMYAAEAASREERAMPEELKRKPVTAGIPKPQANRPPTRVSTRPSTRPASTSSTQNSTRKMSPEESEAQKKSSEKGINSLIRKG